MHPDIKRLNKEDPPPKGFRHPAYEVTNNGGCSCHGKAEWSVSFLNDGTWNMSTITFATEAAAYRHILDILYYGEDDA